MRPGERRDAWAAFFTLFGLIGSHAILETARDALFLAKIPANHLPWVFISVAAISFAITRLQTMVEGVGRAGLIVSVLVVGGVNLGFFACFDLLGRAGPYGLYVWSGLLTTLLLVHFWTLVGHLFTVTQAKRIYGFIGAGSVVGAIVGSGLASGLARTMPARSLLLVSAVGFMATAAAPFFFHRSRWSTSKVGPPSISDNIRYVRGSRYAGRIVNLLLVSTVCLTLSDYVFKVVVAEHVPAEKLGSFLGTVYFALNISSLVAQIVVVGWLVKRASIATTLAVLPALLIFGGAGIAASGGLVAALALRGADGSFRYSLHRTASELLFLPFSDEARRRVKGFMDVVGQRGGQVVASLLLLALAKSSSRTLAILLIIIAVAWIWAALSLREPYLEIFRARLKSGRLTHLEDFPELDVASLETLIATLDSPADNEVTAALRVLERENKVHLIPALILYHPSEEVVELALTIFTRAERQNVVKVLDRLFDHPSARIRAAIISARAVLAPDAQTLLMRMSVEESNEVRATITVQLIAAGDIYGKDAKERLDAILREGTPQTKAALAGAIAGREADGFDDILVALSVDADADVRRAAIRAMARLSRPSFVPALIEGLTEEPTRREAITALAAHGDVAFVALQKTFESQTTMTTLRWRIPFAMTFFDPARATATLLALLEKEPEGGVRFQIIRALERLVRRDPELVLEPKILESVIDQTITRAFRSLDLRAAVARGAKENPQRLTTGHELLCATLRDKEKNAIERVFRLLGLAHPREDFAQIHRGLNQDNRDLHATSFELLANILNDPYRGAVQALVDDLEDDERLAQAGKYHEPVGLPYEKVLYELQQNESEIVREVATYHLAELEQNVPPSTRVVALAIEENTPPKSGPPKSEPPPSSAPNSQVPKSAPPPSSPSPSSPPMSKDNAEKVG